MLSRQMNPAITFTCYTGHEMMTRPTLSWSSEDQAAVDAHGQSDAFKAASANLGGCMAGPPEVQMFDGV